jgi:tetratricopeptide (TPR) repeat protein
MPRETNQHEWCSCAINIAASLRDGWTDNFDNAKFYMNDHSVRKWNELAAGILAPFQSLGVLSMRRVLWGLLVFVLCLPLAFVLYLVAAARYPSMDRFTEKLPATVGAAIAQVALQRAGFGKDEGRAVDRAIRLDPASADAWSRRCRIDANGATTGDTTSCRAALRLDPSEWNYNGLGAVQEYAGDFCAAEDSYTKAIQKSFNDALLLRNMARAALRCGHPEASVAGFEAAEGLDAKDAADPDNDGVTKPYLLADREYLVVAYGQTKQPDKAAAMCVKTHPDWKSCHCELAEKDRKCAEGPSAMKAK